MSFSLQPLVSVVMAVLDPHPNYFRQAVHSILQQTLTDFELIVVEDPGARSAAHILAEVDDCRIRYYCNPIRTSLVEQRNRGLAEARAPLVALMDADDVAEPERLRKQYGYLQSHPEVDVLGSHIQAIDESGRPLGYRCYPEQHSAILRALRLFPAFCHPSVMVRREVVLAAGGYRQARYPIDDYELWSRLALRGAGLGNYPEPLLRYRIHSEQMKQARLRELIRGILAVKEGYWRGEMGWLDRGRAWAERLMLCLPPKLVLRLFLLTHYRAQLPVSNRQVGEIHHVRAGPAASEGCDAAPASRGASTCAT